MQQITQFERIFGTHNELDKEHSYNGEYRLEDITCACFHFEMGQVATSHFEFECK
jgi:hypothetical protein